MSIFTYFLFIIIFIWYFNMINNYKKQYKQFNLYQPFSDHIVCNQDEYIDSLLTLKQPQIISNINNNIISADKPLINLENNLIDVKENNINTNNSSKFDKKNKSNLYTEDILEIKKKKNKLQKKNRKQNVIEGDNVFRNNNSNLFLNEDNLNHDIIKVPKVTKHKKKLQNKIEIIEDTQIKVEIQENIPDNFLHKEIVINSPITIQELSSKLKIPEAEIITYLFLKGISVTVNQMIDIAIAKEVAVKYDFIVKKNITNEGINSTKLSPKIVNDNNKLIKRPPIITILGHVDHGKTTLLDSILKTNLVTQEFGGITQAIANYEIEFLYEKILHKLIFLDTPGHQAFSSIRMRGTQVTDLIVLVVAADDGLKPQTIESIQYIFEQKLPYIVVINKIDKLGINTLKVREDLAEYNIIDASWGGDAIIIEVSALKRQNIDLLLSNICLLSDLQDLKADPDQLASGTIIETYLDIQRGPIAILVVQNGSLKIGDFIVSGNLYGKVKNIIANHGIKQKIASPSSIVEVLGFSSLPKAGDIFHVVHNKKSAEYKINHFENSKQIIQINNLNNRVTLDSIHNQGSLKSLNLILKTDAQGSSEAIVNAFNNISQAKVQINILQLSFGNISNKDIELASTSKSIILGFNVNISSQANDFAKKLNVVLQTFNIIYNLIDFVILNMLNLVEPEYDQLMIGKAIVQTVFYINKGSVAGCKVIEGKLTKGAFLNIYRNSKIIYNSTLNSLKRVKDDVNEVIESNECGIMCYDYNLWNTGDIIEAYELKEKEKVL
uniref:Translation initiation factor IF-2, chloroplastic n=1 Tax=Campylaephora sungminbooi TaxID=1896769 RepID=A0A1B0RRQ3_9FLOR|nr:translation initiation factor IF-2 [Campylaephora sungminbooi]AKU47455.1 translation initiation factor IF-2 [Campylaephora sungminbooi]ALN11902.1 translation initiation factor IF-2 [Campylaephora sungminbooi]